MDGAGYREPAPEPRLFESIAGVDSLRREGARLVLFSPDPMPEWRVGKYRKTAIRFRGARYAVAAARPVVGGYEYALDPWPPRPNELAAQEIVYDEAYVRGRRADLAALRTLRKQFWMLAPAWPLLGFLSTGLKAGLQRRFGLEPIGATKRSVLLEIVAAMVLTGKIVVGSTSLAWPLVFLLVDAALRMSILFEDSYPAYGLGEWIIHPEVKAALRASYARYKVRRREGGER